MTRLLIFIFISSFLFGCERDVVKPDQQQSTISGLELTFQTINPKHNFSSIFFVNEQVGFVAGYDGLLYKTENGGDSWIALNSNTTLPLNDIFFLNEKEGFVVGGAGNCGGTGCIPKGGLIIHTTDGGQTWSQVPITLSEKVELISICFPSDSIGYAVGHNLILSTSDKGATWRETKMGNLGGLMQEVKFIDNQHGLLTYNNGTLLETKNGGTNWNIINSLPSDGLNTLAFVNKTSLFSADYQGVVKSSDFGANWVALPNSPKNTLKLIFTSENVGYAFGIGEYSGGDLGVNWGSIYFTEDGGSSWIGSNKIRETSQIKSASFPSQQTGYAVSANTIIKIRKR